MLKIINTMALVVTLMAGLSSCEMKDEILGKDPMSGDTGTLSLYVETGKTTKGTTDQVDQFPVTITGTDVEYTKKFDSYAELKQAGDVTLPVGTYTIEACSPGEFKSEMSEPFYGGKLENVKIVKGQTAETSVVCTMQNVKISISFTEEFLATYQDWTITVTDKNRMDTSKPIRKPQTAALQPQSIGNWTKAWKPSTSMEQPKRTEVKMLLFQAQPRNPTYRNMKKATTPLS